MPESWDFEAFVESRSDALLRSAWVLAKGDWALAEDIVQTTLVAVWRRWERVARMDHPSAYARKVLVNTYLSWSKRNRPAEVAADHALSDVAAAADDFAQVDLRHCLQRALDSLTPKQRAIVMLRYFDDCSEAETARALGCSKGTVKSQTAKSLARLRSIPDLADVLAGGGFHDQ